MDKKLTDSEIVKALESYIKDIGCAKCDFKDKYLLTVLKSALDLINRLQAENKELKDTVKVLRIGVEQAHLIRKDGKSPFNLLKAEIKAKAYKEFAEKMKGVIPGIDDTYIESFVEDYIDNLLKEMVGEDDAKEKE